MRDNERDVTGVSTIPEGVAGTGTLAQDAQVPEVLIGTGTDFYTELRKPRIFLFFPNTSPPQMLQVADYAAKNDPILPQEADWVKVAVAPAVAIAGESFVIISATLREFGVLNKGGADGTFDEVSIIQGETIKSQIAYTSGNGVVIPKDAHWVDGSGTVLEIYELK